MGIFKLDDVEDKDLWKKKVKGKDMGYQLFARDNTYSNFLAELNINSIPRFIMIGPEQEYISKDAPRPSSPKLKRLLQKLNL